MEDKRLVTRCKQGSKDALGRIYEKYKTDLLVLAMALLNDSGAAEDAVHDAFVSFVRAIDRYRFNGSLKGFLLTCVANRARNMIKAKHRQCVELTPEESVCSGAKGPPQSILCNEHLEALSRALAQLPYEQREIIMLHFQGEMTFTRIADAVGISVNTAKSRYRYGLDKLRSYLDGEEEE